MIFKQIKPTADYKVLTNTRKLIGYITVRKNGYIFRPKNKEFIGMVIDKTFEDCKKRAEVFYKKNKHII